MFTVPIWVCSGKKFYLLILPFNLWPTYKSYVCIFFFFFFNSCMEFAPTITAQLIPIIYYAYIEERLSLRLFLYVCAISKHFLFLLHQLRSYPVPQYHDHIPSYSQFFQWQKLQKKSAQLLHISWCWRVGLLIQEIWPDLPFLGLNMI